MKKFEFHINAADAGKRIDIKISELSGLTRSQIQRLIEKGFLRVNNFKTKPNYKTKTGDLIYVEIPDELRNLTPENIPVDILYMDDFIAVVNKPSGMVVYPAAGHSSGTLLNAIAYHSRKLSSVGAPLRAGIVHRLDKDTSGVLVVALDDGAYYNLIEQFKKRTIKKIYKVIVSGNLKADKGEISKRIGRSVSDRKKMSTKVRKGKEALTTWKVTERFKDATCLEVRLETGRTHQIRVHFASAGHPVLGDKTYGRKTFLDIKKKKIIFPRHMLHAELLGFHHPMTGKYMEFKSALPQDMKENINELRDN